MINSEFQVPRELHTSHTRERLAFASLHNPSHEVQALSQRHRDTKHAARLILFVALYIAPISPYSDVWYENESI